MRGHPIVRAVLRWTRRLVLGALALVVVALVVALIVVHTDWGRERIRREAEAALRDTFPGGASIGRVEGSVLGELTLRDVELRAIDGQPAVRIDTLTVEAAVLPLVRKRVVLEAVTASGVHVRLGGAALTKPDDEPSEPSEPSAWSIELPSIAVRDATVELIGERPIALDRVALDGALAIPADGPLAGRVRLTGTWRERALPIAVDAGVRVADAVMVDTAVVAIGDAQLAARELVIDPARPAGTLHVVASPAAIAAIAPDVALPGPATLAITATPGRAAGTELTIAGAVGGASLHAALHADLDARTARGFVGIGAADLAALTAGQLRGGGELALAIATDPERVHATGALRGAVDELPAGDATVMIDGTWRAATVRVLATAAGGVHASATATARWTGEAAWLDRARVVVEAHDLGPMSGQRVALASRPGVVADVALVRPGPVWPARALEVTGEVRGDAVRFDDLAVARLAARFGAKLDGETLTATGHADARRIARGGEPVGDAVVDARLRPDGRIAARVAARPAAAALGVVADAVVTPGDVIDIAIGHHRVTPDRGAAWAGRGGHVTIADDAITVRGLTTASTDGHARIDARLDRVTDALDVTLDARGLPAAAIDPALGGTASGRFVVRRRGARWDVSGTVDADRIAGGPGAPVVDGKLALELHGRELVLDASARGDAVGTAGVRLEVQGPRDVTDLDAWRRLERGAVKLARLELGHVDLAAASPAGGRIDGHLELTATAATGQLVVDRVATPFGAAGGVVAIAPRGRELSATWNAHVQQLGEANVVLIAALPDRPFDPAVWTAHGRDVVRALSASVEDIAIDPEKLAKLDLEAPYRGRAGIQLAIGAAAATATIDVDVHGLEGGTLRQPIDVHLEATTDPTHTVAGACAVRAGSPACGAGVAAGAAGPPLFELTSVDLPVTFSTWLAAPRAALSTALSGKLAIPEQSAPALLAVLGRHDFDPRKGRIAGAIALGGTLGAPTATAEVTVHHLQLRPRIVTPGRTIPELVELVVSGGWDGHTAMLGLRARESDGGEIHGSVTARPDALAGGKAIFGATRFELAPLAALLPGELAASSGRLRAAVAVTGLSPDAFKVRGDLHVEHGYVPIAPVVGTLADGRVDAYVTDAGIRLRARGMLNACQVPEPPRCTQNVELELTAPNDVSRIDGSMTVRKISPLAEIEPVIDGKARIALVRHARQWTGDIYVRDGFVRVPPSAGDDLLEAELPDDVFFIENPPPDTAFSDAREPERPWLVANVHLASTPIEVEEYGVHAAIASRGLQLLVGDTIGLDGALIVERGDADDIFGRQYRIEPNEIVRFERTIEPIIDLQMTHTFPELVLTMKLQGRPSDPDFPTPRFVADPPGRYTEGELFGFFLGGTPSGSSDATLAAREAATAATTSLLSQRIVARVKNVLPKRLQLDVIKCEPGTSTVGASCTFGLRFADGKVYVSYKRRFVPLPNENPDEGQLQYYLSPRWFIEGAGGSANIFGADLLWRRRW